MNKLLQITLLLVGCYLVGQSVYMDAKAKVAQVLISSSWNLRADDRPPPKPWWWADTRAIAKLDVPRLDKTVYVMQDDSGESLAFGPGHLANSQMPGTDGHVVISGHRDSHFSFLQDIKEGDIVETSNYMSEDKRYQVTEIRVIDITRQQLRLNQYDKLTLITCYPFESFIPGGPLRLVVEAVPITT